MQLMDEKTTQSMNLILENSEKNAWSLNKLLPEDFRFDISKLFIPFAGVAGLDVFSCFNSSELLLISQLRAVEYTRLIHLVEEFIVDIAIAQLRPNIARDSMRFRLLSRFVDEELKHQMLFERMGNILKTQTSEKIIIPNISSGFSKRVMQKHPLSIWLLALHGEVTTRFHYTEIFKSNQSIEPKFIEILKSHWLEESQHVLIDCIEINELLLKMSEIEKKQVIKDYLSLLVSIDDVVKDSSDVLIQNILICNGSNLKNQNLEQKLSEFLIKSLREFFVYIAFQHPTLTHIIYQIDASFNADEVKKMIEKNNSFKIYVN